VVCRTGGSRTATAGPAPASTKSDGSAPGPVIATRMNIVFEPPAGSPVSWVNDIGVGVAGGAGGAGAPASRSGFSWGSG
jgi:hypothetical protein